MSRSRRRPDGAPAGSRPLYGFARSLQLAGLVVTGVGLWKGVLGGNVRLELALLGVGAAVFFAGRWLQARAR